MSVKVLYLPKIFYTYPKQFSGYARKHWDTFGEVWKDNIICIQLKVGAIDAKTITILNKIIGLKVRVSSPCFCIL